MSPRSCPRRWPLAAAVLAAAASLAEHAHGYPQTGPEWDNAKNGYFQNAAKYGEEYCNVIVNVTDYSANWNYFRYDATRVYLQVADILQSQSLRTDLIPLMNRCSRKAMEGWAWMEQDGNNVNNIDRYSTGLRMRYQRFGEQWAKDMVQNMLNKPTTIYDVPGWSACGQPSNFRFAREMAYMLENYLEGRNLGLPVNTTHLNHSKNQLLGMMDQWFVNRTADYLVPFHVGLAGNALIQYYEEFSQDQAIIDKLKLAADGMRARAWDPASQSWYYSEFNYTDTCHGSLFIGRDPAPPLNMIIVPIYAFVYAKTGDPKYRDWGDEAFYSAVDKGRNWYNGGGPFLQVAGNSHKEFAENYRYSPTYLRLRDGGINPPAPGSQYPTVSITAPVNNAAVTVGADVTITADAADPDGNVTKVEFFAGTALIGSDAASPYSATLSNISGGTHVLTAKATDNNGNVAASAAVTISANQAPAPGDLGLSWALDGSLSDASGNNNTGTISGGVTYAAGKNGQAASFNGSDGQIKVDTTRGLNLTGALTIAAWLNPSDVSGAYRQIVLKGRPGAGFGLNLYNGRLNFVKIGVADVTSAVTPQTGVFQHVAVTFDPAAGAVRFYKDGALSETINDAAALIGTSDADDLLLGAWFTGGGNFAGMMDDVRIYNRALGASEVASLAGGSAPPPPPPAPLPPPAPVPPPPSGVSAAAQFLFENNADDSSGKGNNAALQNGAAFAAGRVGQALSLDGVDDQARVPTTSGMNLSGPLTLAAFIKPTSLAGGVWGFNTIVMKSNASNGASYGMSVRNGMLNFVPGDVTSTVSIAANVFQHVAVTYDAAANEVKFYKDGTLMQTLAPAQAITAAADADDLIIGMWPGGGSAFAGLIDNLEVHGRALSAAEIAALAAASAPAPAPTDLNGDGATNVADVQLSVNQALGQASCGAGDVNRDGVCNVSDVQLVVNASLAG